MPAESHSDHYLKDAVRQFRALKSLADKAVAQITDADLFFEPDTVSNSIAVIMIHMAGNMRSRWTDFLTTDGEKPNRNRDMEFVVGKKNTRERVLDHWEMGWRCLFGALEPLHGADMTQSVTIRAEPHTVTEAINRQLTHYAYHVGQIVYLARQRVGGKWRSLSIPRGESEGFDAGMMGRVQ